MTMVKATLFRRDADGDHELELGVFNQGVHFEQTSYGRLLAIDTASGKNIAFYITRGGQWKSLEPQTANEPFTRIHIQAVA